MMFRILLITMFLCIPVANAHQYIGDLAPRLDPYEMDLYERFENAMENRVDMFLKVTKRQDTGEYVAVFKTSGTAFLFMDTDSPPIRMETYQMDLLGILSRLNSNRRRFADKPGKLVEDSLAISEILNKMYLDIGEE